MPRSAPHAPVPPASPGSRAPAVIAVLATQLGPLHAAAIDEGIVALELRTTDEAFAASVRGRTRHDVVAVGSGSAAPAARAHLADLERQVDEHLAGSRQAFDLPVVFAGCSDWDRRVLEGVRTIPRGETASYGEVARRIGRPGAARAVGGAVGRNPLGLIVPCHRVIAGDGTLGGYGGSWFGSREELLGLKERLLELEGIEPPPRSGAGARTRGGRWQPTSARTGRGTSEGSTAARTGRGTSEGSTSARTGRGTSGQLTSGRSSAVR